MKSRLQRLILKTFKIHLSKERVEQVRDYVIAKESLKIKVTATHLIKDIIFISLGILSAGFGLKGFLLPNEFIDGGVTGISLLTEILTDYPLTILIVVINAPFIILGYFTISKSFALKSVLAIIG
jgi:uncharacterized membrane-anchored protein YitT (DUF2179 family)